MLQIGGQGGELLQVDAAHRAGRVSLRPLDVGANGAYRVSAISGSIAATLAASAALFSWRWTDTSKLAVLHDLQVGVVVNGSITTAVAMAMEAVFARAFTASDSGGTSVLPSGNGAKARTTFGTTLLGDARIASTAALTGGTRTLDTNGFGLAVGGSGTTAGAQTAIPMQSIYRPLIGAEHPLVFAQNEGFVIRSLNTGPATGTFQIAVVATWSEVASYGNGQL